MDKSDGFFSMSRLERNGTLMVLVILVAAIVTAVLSRGWRHAVPSSDARQIAFEQLALEQQADTASTKKLKKSVKKRHSVKAVGKPQRRKGDKSSGDKQKPDTDRDIEQLPRF